MARLRALHDGKVSVSGDRWIEDSEILDSAERNEPRLTRPHPLFVGVFGFDLELRLTGFANPMVFAVDKSVIVNPFTVVGSTEITLHSSFVSTLKTPFNDSIALLSGIWD